MSDERRPIEAWASRLGGKGEPLTMPEAQLLAQIAATDRALEMLTALQDVQMRLTRLESFVAATVPGYDQAASVLVKHALGEGKHGD
jgi:hypothetical protein